MDGAWATPQMDKVNVADDQASGKKFFFLIFFYYPGDWLQPDRETLISGN